MKIAQVVCVFPPYKGGMGSVAWHFAKILAQLGHNVVVFTPAYNNPGRNEDREFKVRRIKPVLRFGNGAFVPQLTKMLNDFDIIHLHYPFFGGAEVVWLMKVLGKSKFKLVIHYHMDTLNLSLPAKFLSFPSRAMRASFFKQAAAVTSASLDYIKNSDIKKYYKENPEKFYEIPFGVDLNRFYPALDKKHKEKIILFVGGLDKAHNFKGLDILLAATAVLKIRAWRLRIVGDGDLRFRYESLARQLEINKQVKFLGKVSNRELPACYRQADLFVLPSVSGHEAFGLVLLEAMASGIPVIASDLPGVRRVFENNVQGLLVRPGEAGDLCEKMEIIFKDQELRRRLGRAGRKLVKEKYSWERGGEELNSLYENLFNK